MNKLLGEAYPGCDSCTILQTTDDGYPTLAEGDHWVLSLRVDDQTLVGTSFISAKRHVPEVDYLTPDEEQEFVLLRNGLYSAIRRSFQPVTFNISCLKNDALREEGATSDSTHVHYHVKPRYDRTISVNGEEFIDPMPGHYLSSFQRHCPRPETARAIFDTISSNLDI